MYVLGHMQGGTYDAGWIWMDLDGLFDKNPMHENWGYPHLWKPPCECMARADMAMCGSNAASKKMLLKESHKSHYGVHYGHQITSGCL